MAYSNNSTVKLPTRHRILKCKARARSNSDKIVFPLAENEDMGYSITNHQRHHSSRQDSLVSNNLLGSGSLVVGLASCSIAKDIALPRVVLCLAYNGKVAWDVKWLPYNVGDSTCKQRMGYLAVLLGNGSLEVWEVPLPQTMKVIYSSSSKDDTDPRFVKLEPVFRCSMLKCGEIQWLKGMFRHDSCWECAQLLCFIWVGRDQKWKDCLQYSSLSLYSRYEGPDISRDTPAPSFM